MRLYFYSGFNNYYNRKVKKFNTIQEYRDYLIYVIDNISFDPKDGIITSQIVPTRSIINNQAFISDTAPDYAILCEDDGDIVSRWFVIQWDRKCKGQYLAQLRRDVIADNFEEIIEAPCFIEKATITDKTDVAIFNNENMGFNQIKKGETLLTDNSRLGDVPWIVGYVPTNMETAWKTQGSYSMAIVDYDDALYEYLPQDEFGPPDTLIPLIRPVPKGMPFKMFCMPLGELTFEVTDYDSTIKQFTTNGDVNLAMAGEIVQTYGSNNVIDIQLLPYCPIRDKILLNPVTHQILVNRNQIPCEFIIKSAPPEPDVEAGIIFWSDTNKFTFNITCELPLPDTALEMKVKNECDMYRLCSPNFNGQFEFNPMKNGGVTKFNVDCTYQPYNPYIHINPIFNEDYLYGKDFDDCRGLICGGDFSLPKDISSWADYQQNNKNFQQIFDRQIQNMERNNSYDQISSIASALTGIGQAVGTGAYIGSGVQNVGNIPLGTKGGAISGGVLSGIGGAVDFGILLAKQKETLDYTKDQFDFNMGNIKAMPNSISKTNPFTNNNKIFPLLEYYSCTETEKQALRDKLKYNGMTIGRIGKIKDWLLDDYSYIKGQLIMLEDIHEEYHTLLEIATELNKGIRAKKEED